MLDPIWWHTISNILGHPMTSEEGSVLRNWVAYQEFHDITDFLVYWKVILLTT